MKTVFSIYRNPEAKRALYLWIIITILSGILLHISLHLVYRSYHIDATYHLTKSLAVVHTQDSLDTFFNEGILSPQAQEEFNRLTNLSITPHLEFPSVSTPLLWLWLGWSAFVGATLLAITLHFKKFYAHINTLQQFVQELSYHHKPYDIRQNKEGELSFLNNQLYDMATSLYTQRDTAIQHKNYLNKHIANISHQLKTPLTSLMVVSDTLKILPLNERTNEKIEQLEPQIERIEYLVQSLLLLARLDAGVIQVNITATDTHEFINSILQRFDVLTQHNHITIETHIQDSTLFADVFYLREALTNVLKNAIDYTSPHGKITLTLEDSIFFTTIKVHNTGPLIPKHDLPYIFERFYRGSQHKQTGIGIGLSLAQELVRHHNGKLHAENTQTGVLMTLSIPKP
ncbi:MULTISPECIES: sensor histidine kinase KdpD [unclassified Granulicatella]|uniref:sensor histidine kinase n=1 Tax=unclassified Granulicatella TaxID=2630493 RepID=UPI0010735E9C|nr:MULTISPECIES: HAMP domain-containing sensor histidine kinase [unclassified Granulicatella]MBF0780085.1 HAMP domain-containing histidine kinase [Granulicatella sp. 19428wC4_WM01]TFU95811.1 HAMP domain-containing histidine kinase [Granulicatella sp. WM01]